VLNATEQTFRRPLRQKSDFDIKRHRVKIHFAHRTFQWNNEARGKAAVHCVIIGWALHDTNRKTIFDYPDINGQAHAMAVSNINPYLVDALDVLLAKRRIPICTDSPPIAFGSMPNDGGHFMLSKEQRDEFMAKEPEAKEFIRPLMGSVEFINSLQRWCLWLVDASPKTIKSLPLIRVRVEKVKEVRSVSKRPTTISLADSPTLFGEIRQPKNYYLVIPEVSSENRPFIPIGFLQPEIIATNKLYTIDAATLAHFGVLSSSMHMAWMRYVAGRLKSDFQYSAGIVYNNFPWPADPTDNQREAIEQAGQGVLDARAAHPEASLADLYDPIAMPPDLRKAHQALDKAVDAAYGFGKGGSRTGLTDAERMAFLFDLYHKYTSLLPSLERQKQRRKKRG
jgi:hypothetical protein